LNVFNRGLNSRAPDRPKLPGVIDTLGAGYRTLNRHLYLLLLPILLDLFYWLGPRLSLEPVAKQALQTVDELAASSATAAAGTQTAQSWDMIRSLLDTMGRSFNMFSLLSTPLSIPSVLSSLDLQTPTWLGSMPTFTASQAGQVFWLAVLLITLGVLLGSVYMGLAVQVVRDGHLQPGPLARRVPLNAGRYIGLLLLAVAVAFFVGVPLALFIGLVGLLVPLLGSILVIIVWAVLLWLYLGLFFTVTALFFSEVGPLRAMLYSITVVRLSTSSTLGIFLVIVLISLGIPYVWGSIGSSDLAMLVGIVGNAYVGTGLTVAAMIFYRDRIAVVTAAAKATTGNQPPGPGQQ
jgi:hypothetical protein